LPTPTPDGGFDYQIKLNPDSNDFIEHYSRDNKMPWLWWALRGIDSTEHNNRDNSCAVRDSLPYLEAHLASYVEEELRREALKDASLDVGKKLASLVSGGTIDCLISIYELGKVASPVFRNIFANMTWLSQLLREITVKNYV